MNDIISEIFEHVMTEAWDACVAGSLCYVTGVAMFRGIRPN